MNDFVNIFIYYSIAIIVIGILVWNFVIYPGIVRATIQGMKEFEKEKNMGQISSSNSNLSDLKKREIDRDYGDGLGIYVIFAIVIVAMAIAFLSYR
jgi:hypothetical protein